MNKAIGIIGGLGPEAGLQLHRQIITQTARVKKINQDQDHLSVYHFSLPSNFSDRTRYLLGETTQNPADAAYEVIEDLKNIANKYNETIYVGVPCNTFHANPIFCELQKKIVQENLTNIVLLNMIELTLAEIKKQFPRVKKLGLLATQGTYQSGLYAEKSSLSGLEIVGTNEQFIVSVHESIYHPNLGLKCHSPASDFAKDSLVHAVDKLKSFGAELVISGCSEIPLGLQQSDVDLPLIDPVAVLADKLVSAVLGQNQQGGHLLETA